ncbi:amino acid/amide ABC transporter substrate-binding protein, HAAT family [Aromatoleum tolulyticum]|uniref:Amino acid/amide ABC transporter substrate-binding protein, HAAT family n=1 Tax=Aromatoleum tolulyticum TaxID=34027 RepID=A0A1N6V3B3_9RHOO|nr:branched-chain amino acid ABC transporter substrate-binding protein [Aromatoleum tolulyticum]SIQ72365.1 amino acid/amide ABC transporter substrate-binding protein, HAAT family [Aromatoleum tolulyticum]
MKQNKLIFALAAATLAAGAVQAKEVVVRIGHAGPLTGPAAAFGKDGENGARLAIEDANAKGIKIGGDTVKFELVSEDDQADPRTATTVAQRLTDSGVKGVVGHVTSGASIPASRIYEQAGIPVITPSSTSPKLTQQGYKMTFRVIANDLQQGNALGKYAVDQLKAKKIAVIDDRTAYGQGLADAFANSVKTSGGQIAGREFTNDKATDFMAILTKIKAMNPDAVFYGGMDAQAAPLARQMKQLGMTAKLLTGDGGCTGEMIKMAGDALSATTFCTQAGIPLDKMPGGAAFRTQFKQRFGNDIHVYAPYAYDAMMSVIEAMKTANSVEPAKYQPALRSLAYQGVTGPVAFDDKGDIKGGSITVYNFDAGKWAPLQTIQ